MAVYFVEPYVKYYNNLGNVSNLVSAVNETTSNLNTLSNDVNSLSSKIDASKWKELGEELISSSVLPSLRVKIGMVSTDIVDTLSKAVSLSNDLYEKVVLLKEKDEKYEEAKRELDSLKGCEPSYYNDEHTSESASHSSWKSKVNTKAKEVTDLEDECKSLCTEIDGIVSSIKALSVTSSNSSTYSLEGASPLIQLTGIGDGNGNTKSMTLSEVLESNGISSLEGASPLIQVTHVGDVKDTSSALEGASPLIQITNVGDGGNSEYSVSIPSSVKQSGYTVTGYDKWIKSGKTMVWAKGTNQRAVSEVWKSQGSKFKNGIATINVNGEDRYLIATSSTFGKVGDSVTVKLENGQSVKCVIADQKSSHDSNYTKYGHGQSNGSVNVLEFEVERSTYQAKGNPSTSKWNLEWDSSSPVTRIDNNGSVLK